VVLSKPWHKRKAETVKAYKAFAAYLQMPKRSLERLAKDRGWRLSSLSGWSARHAWQERVGQYEAEQLAKDMERRDEAKERLRQKLFDEASEALSTLFGLLRGQIPDEAATIAQMSREGEEVGRLPVVKPGTLKEIIFGILDRIGLGPAKRVELTGKDGKDLEIQARHKLMQMDTETLAQIREVLKGGGENNET